MILACGTISASAQGITAGTTETNINITVDAGTNNAGRSVGIEVVRPKKFISDIDGTDTTGASVYDILEYVDQGVVGSDGTVNFTLVPTSAQAGKFTIHANVYGRKPYTPKTIVFAPQAAVDALIDIITSSSATIADIQALFAPVGPDEVAGYEMLGFGDLPIYALYNSSDYGTADKTNAIQKEFLALTKGASFDKAGVQTAFTEATYRGTVYDIDNGADMISYMDEYKMVFGLDNSKLYTVAFDETVSSGSEPKYVDSAAKIAIADNITKINWIDSTTNSAKPEYDTYKEIVTAIEKEIFMKAIADVDDGYGNIGELIALGKDMLIAAGCDFTDYNSKTEKNTWRTVADAKDISDFVEKFNDSLDTPSSDGGGSRKPSSGSSSGSSHTVSIGSSSSGGTSDPVVVPDEAKHFDDIDSVPWAKEGIDYMLSKGYISGKEAGKFYPNDNMTRAEFVKVIMVVFGLYDASAQADFTDVDIDNWAYSYIASAAKYGIVNGVGDGVFGANNQISREDAAVILLRCVDAINGQLDSVREDAAFVDYDDVADYAKEAVSILYKAGVIDGMDANSFAPKNNITRAQAVKLLYVLTKSMELNS